MYRRDDRFVAAIPKASLVAPYALQYFFVLRDSSGFAWLHPGLEENLSNQPYSFCPSGAGIVLVVRRIPLYRRT